MENKSQWQPRELINAPAILARARREAEQEYQDELAEIVKRCGEHSQEAFWFKKEHGRS